MAEPGTPPPPYGVPESPIRSSLAETNGMDSHSARPQHRELSLETGARIQAPPLSPVRINSPQSLIAAPSFAHIETYPGQYRTPPEKRPPEQRAMVNTNFSRLRSPTSPWASRSPEQQSLLQSERRAPIVSDHAFGVMKEAGQHSQPSTNPSGACLPSTTSLGTPMQAAAMDSPSIIYTDEQGAPSYFPNQDGKDGAAEAPEPEPVPQLQYFHNRGLSEASGVKEQESRLTPPTRPVSSGNMLLSRPMSTMMLDPGRRSVSPGVSPDRSNRSSHSPYGRRSPANRPVSYVDLLNAPYPQPAPAATNLNNNALRPAVGINASLLSSQKTFEMYKANVKKTNDPKVQYEFALFMINAAQEARDNPQPGSPPGTEDSPLADPESLIHEAQKILEKLADRSYPFAQYYLGDGLVSGIFTKNGEPDNDHALPLFVAASKHGHAEAGYRAGLCYEHGWGTRRDGPKAAQYFRASASKSHPGSMLRLSRACLHGDLGLPYSEREGVRWLRRAAEAADLQFNAGPFELARLHEEGYGDDVFKDEAYAAQMYTKSAELGHAEAGFKMGEAYELGKLGCPRDPALSVHFYNGAAMGGHPGAMMGLCAWYLVGAGEMLLKDEAEAFEWARRAAEMGLPKACYAVGYFTEMGIGCRRDPLESNVWYVKAADLGDERAKHRLAAIQAAASGGNAGLPELTDKGSKKKDKTREKSQNRGKSEDREKKKRFNLFKGKSEQ